MSKSRFARSVTTGDYLKRWGFRPQKPIKHAYERNERKIRAWLEEEYPAIEAKAHREKAEIHWGDETGISNQDQIGRGYAPKGKTPVRKHAGKRERINMISTCDQVREDSIHVLRRKNEL